MNKFFNKLKKDRRYLILVILFCVVFLVNFLLLFFPLNAIKSTVIRNGKYEEVFSLSNDNILIQSVKSNLDTINEFSLLAYGEYDLETSKCKVSLSVYDDNNNLLYEEEKPIISFGTFNNLNLKGTKNKTYVFQIKGIECSEHDTLHFHGSKDLGRDVDTYINGEEIDNNISMTYLGEAKNRGYCWYTLLVLSFLFLIIVMYSEDDKDEIKK